MDYVFFGLPSSSSTFYYSPVEVAEGNRGKFDRFAVPLVDFGGGEVELKLFHTVIYFHRYVDETSYK